MPETGPDKTQSGVLNQLYERQVFKTLILYGVVGWGIYEITREYLVQFGFPEYSPRVLLILMLLGLPAALFLSWYLDIDRRGIHKEAEMLRRDWLIIAASLLLPIAGTVIAIPWAKNQSIYIETGNSPERSDARVLTNAIAVLPFTNMTGDASLEYLADGVAEEVTGTLSGMGVFNVLSKGLAFQIRDSDLDAESVGQNLKVAYLVRGSVRQAGQQFRLTASLTSVKKGLDIWSQSTDVNAADIFSGQDQLSLGVSEALIAELKLKDAALPASREPPDAQAYDLYLKGRHIWHQRGSVDLQPAIDYFAEAVRIDPDFATGWSALASAYLTYPSYSRKGWPTWRFAEDAAKKAIEIDPGLAEPRAVLAAFSQYRMQWSEAAMLYVQALEMNDSNPTVHYWYGEHLAKMGRYSESVLHMERAISLDPTYLAPQIDLAFSYLSFGDYEESLDRFTSVWDRGNRGDVLWVGIFINKIVLQQYEAALQWLKESPLPEITRQLLRRSVELDAGRSVDPGLERDLTQTQDVYIDYRLLIWLSARLNFFDTAFEVANSQLQRRNHMDTRPLWGPGITLTEQAPFGDLVEKLGLVEYWQNNEWGDICRPAGQSFICDRSKMTRENLRRLLQRINN